MTTLALQGYNKITLCRSYNLNVVPLHIYRTTRTHKKQTVLQFLVLYHLQHLCYPHNTLTVAHRIE